MLIPSIDLMGGRIVQLVQGERLQLAFDDFEYWIERFSRYPLVQLIDLDAAMRKGENRALIEQLCKRLPCQVGGGIHTAQRAGELLSAGAKRVIFGSALFGHDENNNPEGEAELVRLRFAQALADTIGRKHLVFSVDAKGGRVAVKGWTEQVALTPAAAIRALEPFCEAFLYTHIDKEGTMQGFPFAIAAELRRQTSRKLIVAGGIRTQAEIDALDRIAVDAVAGMAVYTGHLAT